VNRRVKGEKCGRKENVLFLTDGQLQSAGRNGTRNRTYRSTVQAVKENVRLRLRELRRCHEESNGVGENVLRRLWRVVSVQKAKTNSV